jgi:hypothetical protein
MSAAASKEFNLVGVPVHGATLVPRETPVAAHALPLRSGRAGWQGPETARTTGFRHLTVPGLDRGELESRKSAGVRVAAHEISRLT